MNDEDQYSLEEKMNKAANSDTPEVISVPRGMQSLVVWAIGRFGTGVIGVIGCYLLYTDMKEDKKRNEVLIERYITTMVRMENSIDTNNKVLDRIAQQLSITR